MFVPDKFLPPSQPNALASVICEICVICGLPLIFGSFSRANAQLWLLLGEAQSKCEHIAGVPLRPNVAKELKDVAQNLNFAAAQFFQKVF